MSPAERADSLPALALWLKKSSKSKYKTGGSQPKLEYPKMFIWKV
jgi:hypothetical protein